MSYSLYLQGWLHMLTLYPNLHPFTHSEHTKANEPPTCSTQLNMKHRAGGAGWPLLLLGALEGPLGPGSAEVGQALALSWSAHHASWLMLTVAPRPSCSQLWRPCSHFTCGLFPWTTGFLQLLTSLISLLVLFFSWASDFLTLIVSEKTNFFFTFNTLFAFCWLHSFLEGPT